MIYRVYSLTGNEDFRWVSYFQLMNGFYYGFENSGYWEVYKKTNPVNNLVGIRDDRFLGVYKTRSEAELEIKKLTKYIIG